MNALLWFIVGVFAGVCISACATFAVMLWMEAKDWEKWDASLAED